MTASTNAIPLFFYRNTAGREPAREWLSALPPDDRRAIGFDIRRVQLGWPIGLPVCRPMADGLFEVRSSLPSRREARVLFGFHERKLVALHAFIKKAQRTPPPESWLWHDNGSRRSPHDGREPAYRFELRELAR